VRDTITFCTEHLPLLNTVSVCGYHMREAGATREQCLAFTFSNGIAYLDEGVNAGLDIDRIAPRITFLSFSGSMEILKEIALHRAARRMWAKIMRERFGSKNPRNWAYKHVGGAMSGYYSTTAQRPLNNLTRAVLGGVAAALVGDNPSVEPPYDEPLGLGWSLEAQQLSEDAARIIQYEAGLKDVIDPFAGSYFMESMTNQIEEKAWEIIEKIDSMGGSVSAIEQGFMQQEVARSAHQFQKEVENGERIVVGVNSFLGETELDVVTSRLVSHPYDPDKRAQAEEIQRKSLEQVKRSRDDKAVTSALSGVKAAAKDESKNMIPPILEAVKAYATLGEICDTLRDVFGEYQGYGSI
jgi:methylmalonyl-CoA mutase N-terminal domain/subunit